MVEVLGLGRVQLMSSQELTYKKYPHTSNPGQDQKNLTEALKIPKSYSSEEIYPSGKRPFLRTNPYTP